MRGFVFAFFGFAPKRFDFSAFFDPFAFVIARFFVGIGDALSNGRFFFNVIV